MQAAAVCLQNRKKIVFFWPELIQILELQFADRGSFPHQHCGHTGRYTRIHHYLGLGLVLALGKRIKLVEIGLCLEIGFQP